MTEALVSVVMATLNAERFLAESLKSVTDQSLKVLEVIVVDGGSSDRTTDIAAQAPRTRVLRQQGRGFAAAWNEGIRAARGSLIALLDSDDRWRPEKLRLQVDRIEQAPTADVVLGRVRFFLTGDPPPHFKMDLLEHDHEAHMPGALLARRGVFDRIGWFGEEWAIASDVDWFARLADSDVPWSMLDQVVLEKRVHSSNLSYTTARTPVVRREILDALRASVRRKRSQARS